MKDASTYARQILRLISLSDGGHYKQLAAEFDRYCRAVPHQSLDDLANYLSDELDRARVEGDRIVSFTKASAIAHAVMEGAVPLVANRYRHLAEDPALFEILLVSPFLLARAFDLALRAWAQRPDPEFVGRRVADELVNFLGYRPQAVLERAEQVEPGYAERSLPVPLYVRDVGVAHSKYEPLIARLVDVLQQTPEELLLAGSVDLERLEEIAVELRRYDCLMPAFQRPGHVFGEYDPEDLDADGFYRRYVVRWWVLEELVHWIYDKYGLDQRQSGPEQVQELRYRIYAAAVALAGTMLIGAGVCGTRPGFHSSDKTLAHIVQELAYTRDGFYRHHFENCPPRFKKRLERERKRYRQPFAEVRQYLNRALMRRNAHQVLYDRAIHMSTSLGLMDLAEELLDEQTSHFGRLRGEIHLLLSAAQNSTARGDYEQALEKLQAARSALQRSVEHRQIADPWCMVAFGGHYPLGSSPADSVIDRRLIELLQLADELIKVTAYTVLHTALGGQRAVALEAAKQMRQFLEWWGEYGGDSLAMLITDMIPAAVHSRRYADPIQPIVDALRRGQPVLSVLADRNYPSTPEGAALLARVFMDRGHLKDAARVLVQWAGKIRPLETETNDVALGDLALEWVCRVLRRWREHAALRNEKLDFVVWHRLCQFAEALRRHAQPYWGPPRGGSPGEWLEFYQVADEAVSFRWPPRDWRLEELLKAFPGGEAHEVEFAQWDERVFGPELVEQLIVRPPQGPPRASGNGNRGDAADHVEPFGQDPALYDELEVDEQLWADDEETVGMVDEFEPGGEENEAMATAEQINSLTGTMYAHIALLDAISHIWWLTATYGPRLRDRKLRYRQQRTFERWLQQAVDRYRALTSFVQNCLAYSLPQPKTHEQVDMTEYHHALEAWRTLMDGVAELCLDMAQTAEVLATRVGTQARDWFFRQSPSWTKTTVALRSAIERNRRKETRQLANDLVECLRGSTLVYPMWKKGIKATDVIEPRWFIHSLRVLVASLVRAGFVREAYELVCAAVLAKPKDPPPNAYQEYVSEDHEVANAFYEELGARMGILFSKLQHHASSYELARAQHAWDMFTLLLSAAHSYFCSQVHLSTPILLEQPNVWKDVVDFIKEYGGDLFTQQFFSPQNLQTVLHGGVDRYLRTLAESGSPYERPHLAEVYVQATAAEKRRLEELLSLIVRCVADEYSIYQDYNQSTIYSDYGNFLYVLLDFLRIRGMYTRVHWSMQVHERLYAGLLRHGLTIANAWSLREPVLQALGRQLERELSEAERKYGIVLGSLRDAVQNGVANQMNVRFLAEYARTRCIGVGMALEHGTERRWAELFKSRLRTSALNGNAEAEWLKDLVDLTKNGELNRSYELAEFLRLTWAEPRWEPHLRELDEMNRAVQQVVLDTIGDALGQVFEEVVAALEEQFPEEGRPPQH